MNMFVDMPGASGAHYRFRRVDVGALPAMAGNLIVVQPSDSDPILLVCMPAPSLSAARDLVMTALRLNPGALLYVRLNVARAVREAEHADIIAAATASGQDLARKGGAPMARETTAV
ncbi:hypothetical protein ACO2Q0_20920 [Phenylobacterium sp. VNQ135]|uniref:hypothetical protein n=1 Tax=Phenylobacterium sp. VNQ135 TaxID=3400922 RepID=UPI003BFAFB04